MIPGVVDGVETALDPGQGAVEHWRSVSADVPRDAGELVPARDGEGTAERLLLEGQDVDAERPRPAILGQLVELLAGASATMGGSRESDVKAWQVNPTGRPSSIAVTTVTPVANRPSTSLNWSESKAVDPVEHTSTLSSSMVTESGSFADETSVPQRARSTTRPSLAAATSVRLPASGMARATSRSRSISSSVWAGSWWYMSSRPTPQMAATRTA